MQPLERIIPVARKLLTIPIGDEQFDPWLWERAQRVLQLVQLLRHMPEVAQRAVDEIALGAAALFHCAAWAPPVQPGHASRWQMLARPTSDIQRELSAALLLEHVGAILPPKSARLAAEAIRHGHSRGAALLEAHLLAEAEGLDDIGVMYVLRQLRQLQGECRPLAQLVASWQRQREYQYWETRINDGLRFETTRRIARERLRAVDDFQRGLADVLSATDVRTALQAAGVTLPAPADGAPPAQRSAG